jgi:aminoglycoside 6'-N-acetyltransferase
LVEPGDRGGTSEEVVIERMAMIAPAPLPEIGFRPLGEAELPRLVTWLNAPHVAEWWGTPTQAEIEAKYLPRLRGETGTRVYTILLESTPIGMVQATPAQRAGGADACTIDILIGEPTLVGVGLGPRIIDAFMTREVFGSLGMTACFADPVEANRRSVRAFEKAGFQRLRTFEAGGQTVTLMIRERGPDAMGQGSGAPAARGKLASNPRPRSPE